MSLATGAIPAPELFAKAPRWFWTLGQAGQQCFLELWFRAGFRKGKLRVTDRQIAEWCGRGIRWAQKALRQLLDATVDGFARPMIARYRAYGNRDQAGRIVEIIVDFAEPREADEARGARPEKGKRRGPRPVAPGPAGPSPVAPPPAALPELPDDDPAVIAAREEMARRAARHREEQAERAAAEERASARAGRRNPRELIDRQLEEIRRRTKPPD